MQAPFAEQELTGWANYPHYRGAVFRPESLRELAAIGPSGSRQSYISRGLGRGYGDAALSTDGVISHVRLNRLLAWDPSEHIVACEAGVTLDDILTCFLPQGFFLPVTPGTRHVTVGGALAADVHGKNHHMEGSFARFVDSVQLLTGMGRVMNCSATVHSDVFWATLGGLGLTGPILSARLRLRPVESAYLAIEYRKTANLDDTLAALSDDQQYRYSVAWIDCLARGGALGRAILMRGEHARASDLPPRLRDRPFDAPVPRRFTVPRGWPGFLLGPTTVRAFNAWYYRRHAEGAALVDYDSFFYPLDRIRRWNHLYGPRGFVQFQVALPADCSGRAIRELLDAVLRARRAPFLAVLKLLGAANPGLLSFPRSGHTLALDLARGGPDLDDLLNRLVQITQAHGGRVYLAKDAYLKPAEFQAMYPRAEEFRTLRQRLDPEQRYSSCLSRRLRLDAVASSAREAA
ncbi:MAG: FAD-binding oxidoreductase [Gemmataceae bacterium]|nr:FAD-binding oxidoreductase [Gemmataceae bacterium]